VNSREQEGEKKTPYYIKVRKKKEKRCWGSSIWEQKKTRTRKMLPEPLCKEEVKHRREKTPKINTFKKR